MRPCLPSESGCQCVRVAPEGAARYRNNSAMCGIPTIDGAAVRAGRTGKGIYANFTLKLLRLAHPSLSESLAPGNDGSKVIHGSSEWE